MKMRPLALKINKYSLLFLLFIVFVFLEIIIMSPTSLEKSNTESEDFEKSITATENDKKGVVEQKAQGVHIVENGDNQKSYQLFANEAVGTSDMQWVLKSVQVQFFNENKANYTVAGDVGEIDGTSKDIIIRGHATTSSLNGYRFNTDTLKYISKQKVITSDDSVTMEGPRDKSGDGFRLTGEKLLVDISKNTMSILDKIFTTKLINGKNFKLTAVRADFTNNSQEASFSGDVKMYLGDFNVKAQMASFYYSDINKSFVKILLKQCVVFTELDRKGTCDELEMDLTQNKMTMRGQPKVQQGSDEIRGEEIVFIDGGKKVKINKTKTTLKPIRQGAL
ncbi:MAG: LPS export ABC transporter periplasmic protein LptC [Bdellovibrionota bacterium]